MFSGFDTMGNINARRGDPHSWLGTERLGFEVRILIGQEDLIMAITTKNSDITLFQLRVVEILIKYIRIFCYQKGLLKNISINYITKEDKYITDLNPMTAEDFAELEHLLKTRKEDKKIL